MPDRYLWFQNRPDFRSKTNQGKDIPHTIDGTQAGWLPDFLCADIYTGEDAVAIEFEGARMPAVPELKATLTLPKTEFPMKANLPQNEPTRLARWAELDLYEQLRKGGRGQAELFAA